MDDVFGWNFVNRNNNPNDENGHGTHVAGTIAAERNGIGATGVAYDAAIMPVKVLGDNGSGTDIGVASGIRYAVDNGADVINLSLGGGGNSRPIRSALEYALSNDVFVVIASGNESGSIPSYPAIHSRDLMNVISVGAHDSSERSAGFSNKVGSSRAVQIDAPGVGIYSTLPNNRVGRLNGTSMAAPHVAGVAALALSAKPDLGVSELKSLLYGRIQSIHPRIRFRRWRKRGVFCGPSPKSERPGCELEQFRWRECFRTTSTGNTSWLLLDGRHCVHDRTNSEETVSERRRRAFTTQFSHRSYDPS